MGESNDDTVLHREPLLPRILLITFAVVCIWAGIGWFFAIMTYGVSADVANGILLSWAAAFIIAMAVLLNSGE